jgi:hypothetical protein
MSKANMSPNSSSGLGTNNRRRSANGFCKESRKKTKLLETKVWETLWFPYGTGTIFLRILLGGEKKTKATSDVVYSSLVQQDFSLDYKKIYSSGIVGSLPNRRIVDRYFMLQLAMQ